MVKLVGLLPPIVIHARWTLASNIAIVDRPINTAASCTASTTVGKGGMPAQPVDATILGTPTASSGMKILLLHHHQPRDQNWNDMTHPPSLALAQ